MFRPISTVFKYTLVVLATIYFCYLYNKTQKYFLLSNLIANTVNFQQKNKIRTYFNETISPPAVLLNPIGGIGNQLFQYACSYALAKEKNWPLYLFVNTNINNTRGFKVNQREFALDQFNIPELHLYDKTTIATAPNFHYVGEKNYLERKLPDFKNTSGFIQLTGYCQSIEYWPKYEYEIKQMFQPSETVYSTMPEEIKAILNDIEGTESVALHVRRGDFLGAGGNAFFVPISYQRSAIRRMLRILNEKNTTRPVFFVFSDDIKFAKESFTDFAEKFRFVFVSELNSTSMQDFYLIMNCKHIILPNSTFSWWAAYLNSNANKTIIASAFPPDFWKLKNGEARKFFRKLHGTIYHPSEWVIIDIFSGEQ